MSRRKPVPPGSTQPVLPHGEAPLDAATLDAFLEGIGTDMVLVGGQALAFWMDRYGIAPNGAAISNDGDVLGQAERAERLAHELHAAVVKPDRRALTSLVAQVRIPVGPDGRMRNIDVLHLLYTVSGLRKSREFTKTVLDRSVEMEWKPGRRIRVMHPLHVLDSRVQNAVGLLSEKGPHVLTQATWAIEVARAAMLRVLGQESAPRPAASRQAPRGGEKTLGRPGGFLRSEEERLGQMIQQVFSLARSRAGRQLMREHGIETLHAVPIDEIRRLAPQHESQLRAVEQALGSRARHDGDAKPTRASAGSS